MAGVQGNVGGVPSVMQPSRGRCHHPCEQGFTSAVAGRQASEPLPHVAALLNADLCFVPVDGVGDV